MGTNELRALIDNVSPYELAESATSRTLSSFLLLYADTHLLMIRLREPSGDLESVLLATQVHGSKQASAKPADGMGFHTEIHRFAAVPAPRKLSTSGGLDIPTLSKRLLEGRHFVVPLRKRAEVDALSMERISVGRARNKDIVLRDTSVSKFHGWFEVDEEGGFRLADAGSKNGTKINGRRLDARQPTSVAPGDVLLFGSVEGIVCPADTLWKAMNGKT